MKERSAREKDNAGTPLKFVPGQVLDQKRNEIQNLIAGRAYELFELRGPVPGHEIEDWAQAESELLYLCRHDLKETTEAFTLHIEVQGSFSADHLKVSVEPRRLMVSGEREMIVLCGDAGGNHQEVQLQRTFRVHELPADVDPSKATATLKGATVEIVLPKASPANKPSERAKSASSAE